MIEKDPSGVAWFSADWSFLRHPPESSSLFAVLLQDQFDLLFSFFFLLAFISTFLFLFPCGVGRSSDGVSFTAPCLVGAACDPQVPALAIGSRLTLLDAHPTRGRGPSVPLKKRVVVFFFCGFQERSATASSPSLSNFLPPAA